MSTSKAAAAGSGAPSDSGGITETATPPAGVHWKRPGEDSVAACSGRETRAPLTADRLLVTCGRCRGTRAWIRSADPRPDPPEANPAESARGADVRPGAAPVLKLAGLAPHPANPRDDLGDLTELQASIAEIGLLEPLVVVTAAAHAAGGWPAVADAATHVILVGHRRHAAAVAAGLAEVPCVVRDDLAGADAIVTMIAENDPAKRHALAPLSEARAFAQLAERGWSQRQIAARVGCKQPHVSKRLALLRLPEQARGALASGKITPADAAVLGRLAGHPDRAAEAAEEISRGDRGDAERVVSRHLAQLEYDKAAASVRAAMEAEGVKIVDPGTLGPFSYAKRLHDDAAAAVHQEAGCLVGVARHGARELYCRDPDAHEGTPAALLAWSRSFGRNRAAEDAERAERDRQRAAAARARKDAAARLAVRPVSAGRAAELVSLALIARHADAQCLETAVKWLRAGGIGPADGDHYAYADQVAASGDLVSIRRLAVAMALAGDERAAAGGGDFAGRWDTRQVAYLDRLIDEAGYEPGERERARLDEARARIAARPGMSCPACGCRPGKTCGEWIRLPSGGYAKCDAEPGDDGTWAYRCACGGRPPEPSPAEDSAGQGDTDADRDALFDALEDLVIAVEPAGGPAAQLPAAFDKAAGDAVAAYVDAWDSQSGRDDPAGLLEAARSVHASALPVEEAWTPELRGAFAALARRGVIGGANAAGEVASHG